MANFRPTRLRHATIPMPETSNCASLRVAFAGTPEFAAVALRALLASEHQLLGVWTQPDRKAGRGQKLSPSIVKQVAVEAGVPVFQPHTFKSDEAQQALRDLRPDVLIVAAYGLILPQAVLEIPSMGCLNIHASLLPRWRGAAPIHRAILAGDEETGVCIMQMDAGLDTGDVLLRRVLAIDADDTSASLHDKLALLGSDALLDALPRHCRGELEPQVQTDNGVSYADKLEKSEGAVDFSQSSEALHRQVRALNPWPVAYANLNAQRVRLWSSALCAETAGSVVSTVVVDKAVDDAAPGMIIDVTDEHLIVRTGDGYIALTQLQWPGKKAQAAAQFAQDRDLVGQRFN